MCYAIERAQQHDEDEWRQESDCVRGRALVSISFRVTASSFACCPCSLGGGSPPTPGRDYSAEAYAGKWHSSSENIEAHIKDA